MVCIRKNYNQELNKPQNTNPAATTAGSDHAHIMGKKSTATMRSTEVVANDLNLHGARM